MKKLALNSGVQCMACLACEIACSEAFYKKFDPALSCVRIRADRDGAGKPSVCIQCGKCARVCQAGAILQNEKNGVYMIMKAKCAGCGACIEACPMQVMAKSPEQIAPTKCVACGICAKACPVELLYIQEK